MTFKERVLYWATALVAAAGLAALVIAVLPQHHAKPANPKPLGLVTPTPTALPRPVIPLCAPPQARLACNAYWRAWAHTAAGDRPGNEYLRTLKQEWKAAAQ